MVLIGTERLLLRGLEMGDAADLLALYGDAEVMRYWSHAPWAALAQAETAVREAQEDYAQRRSLHLAIGLRSAGAALIGSCALYDFARQPGAATLGYLLARGHWGQGYAAEALAALLGHGFRMLDLRRINAEVAPENTASLQLLARLGFRRCGRVPQAWQVGGRSCDVEAFALQRSAYNVAHAE